MTRRSGRIASRWGSGRCWGGGGREADANASADADADEPGVDEGVEVVLEAESVIVEVCAASEPERRA